MTIGAARATYDDVNLVIKLYELRRDDGCAGGWSALRSSQTLEELTPCA